MNDERPGNARPHANDEHPSEKGYRPGRTYPLQLARWSAEREAVALALTTKDHAALVAVLSAVQAGEWSWGPRGRASEEHLLRELLALGLLHDEDQDQRQRENYVHYVCGLGQQLGWLDFDGRTGHPAWKLTDEAVMHLGVIG